MKKEGIIVIGSGLLLATLIYLAPRFSTTAVEKNTEATAENHNHSPDSLEIMVQQAVEMLNTGSAPPMQAIGLLRKVVEIEPNHVNGNFYLGYFSIMSGQFDKAKERLSIVLQALPEHADALLLMAQANKGLGQNEEAKAHLKKCLAANPSTETKGQAEALLAEIEKL